MKNNEPAAGSGRDQIDGRHETERRTESLTDLIDVLQRQSFRRRSVPRTETRRRPADASALGTDG